MPKAMEIFFQYLSSLDPVAVLLSAAVMMLIGTLWYSPLLFGRTLMRLSNVRPGDMHPGARRSMKLVLLGTSIAVAALLGVLARYFGIASEARGEAVHNMLGIVAVIWAFIMLNQLRGFTWRREPFQLFLLQTTLTLVAMLAGGLVYCFWG